MDSSVRKKWALQGASLDTGPTAETGDEGDEPLFELIELFFFAYRDFVADADQLLENYGLGRAHHRVLHFVNRRPGLTIAELLDILKITKQSLGRVLKDLLEADYVEVRPGVNDRRQRRLYVTEHGKTLALDVARLQSKRFRRVFARMPDGACGDTSDFLLAMVDAGERHKVAALITSGQAVAGAEPGKQ